MTLNIWQSLKGLSTFVSAFGILFSVAALADAPSSAVPTAPVLIAPADLKNYIQGLRGTIDLNSKTATVLGLIDASCAKLLRLDASGVPVNGRVLFGMYDLGGGLDCLKKTYAKCKVESACSSFEKIDAQTAHRLNRPFKSYVTLEDVKKGDLKIAFSSAGHLSTADTDHRKLEASVGCDCDVKVSVEAKPLKPGQTGNLHALSDVLKASGVKPSNGIPKPKPIPNDDADGDGDGDDEPTPIAAQPLPQIRHTVTPPGLQHVPTSAEMAMQVQQDMAPFMQMAASSGSQNTAYDAFLAQQTQAELGRIQQYRPNNYLLGNSALPGGINLNANTQAYQNYVNESMLLTTPVIPPGQAIPYPGMPYPGIPYPTAPNQGVPYPTVTAPMPAAI